MIYFTPVVSSGPPCAIPPPSQETSPPRVERLLRGSTEKPPSHLFPSANAKTYNMDCILKFTKLIFSDLKRAQHFSSSRDFCAGRERRRGAGGGAGPCADPRCPPPPELRWELRVGWDGGTTTTVGAKLEQPPRDRTSMRRAKLFFGSSGTWRFSAAEARLPPRGFPLAVRGTSPSASTAPQPTERRDRHCGAGKTAFSAIHPKTGTTLSISITKPQCDCLNKLGNLFFLNRNTEEVTTHSFTLSSLF